MGMEDQTKNDFLEALSEIIDRFQGALKNKFSEKDNDLSPKAKEILETLKKNPEEAKEIISEAMKQKIEQNSENFKSNNNEALEQVQGLKLNIDFQSDNANDVLNVMNKYESILLQQNQIVEDLKSKLNQNIELKIVENENNLDLSDHDKIQSAIIKFARENGIEEKYSNVQKIFKDDNLKIILKDPKDGYSSEYEFNVNTKSGNVDYGSSYVTESKGSWVTKKSELKKFNISSLKGFKEIENNTKLKEKKDIEKNDENKKVEYKKEENKKDRKERDRGNEREEMEIER